jgi:predicted GNAT family acetyltransferase
MLIGEAGAVSDLWEAARKKLPRARLDRPGQPVFAISDPPPEGGTGLRAATVADVDLLVPSCAAAHREELGVDPLRRDPSGFRWRTRIQVEQGRSWLWAERDTIRFKAEASAWTPSAVQLQQVWTDTSARRQGFAARALRDLIRLLLAGTPTVCLFVRAENLTAIRLYESVGMHHVLDYRSVLL